MAFHIIVYCIYSFICLGMYGMLNRQVRIPLLLIGGWLVLPVTYYPTVSSGEAGFPYWIVGLSLPSDLWPNKLWVTCVVAATCLCIHEWNRVRSVPRCYWDGLIAAWCCWPLLQGILGIQSLSSGLQGSVYLIGAWGAPWIIGRVVMRDQPETISFLRWLFLLSCFLIPFSLIEGLFGPNLYSQVWGEPHPFRSDGAIRYFGYRPILFFEHGNQYGIWMCMIAIVGTWFILADLPLVNDSKNHATRPLDRVLVGFLIAFAILGQSVGAVLLGLIALGYLYIGPWVNQKTLITVVAILVISGGFLYFSKLIPFRKIATETKIGQMVVEVLRKSGRGSFSWRIGQDEKTLPLIRTQWIQGTGKWDWWRKANTRPWEFATLLLGQFGLIGVVLCSSVLLGTSVAELVQWQKQTPFSPNSVRILIATIVIFSSLDGMSNAFLFLPASVLSGGLANKVRNVLPTHRAI